MRGVIITKQLSESELFVTKRAIADGETCFVKEVRNKLGRSAREEAERRLGQEVWFNGLLSQFPDLPINTPRIIDYSPQRLTVEFITERSGAWYHSSEASPEERDRYFDHLADTLATLDLLVTPRNCRNYFGTTTSLVPQRTTAITQAIKSELMKEHVFVRAQELVKEHERKCIPTLGHGDFRSHHLFVSDDTTVILTHGESSSLFFPRFFDLAVLFCRTWVDFGHEAAQRILRRFVQTSQIDPVAFWQEFVGVVVRFAVHTVGDAMIDLERHNRDYRYQALTLLSTCTGSKLFESLC